jgi:hypothetical protein
LDSDICNYILDNPEELKTIEMDEFTFELINIDNEEKGCYSHKEYLQQQVKSFITKTKNDIERDDKTENTNFQQDEYLSFISTKQIYKIKGSTEEKFRSLKIYINPTHFVFSGRRVSEIRIKEIDKDELVFEKLFLKPRTFALMNIDSSHAVFHHQEVFEELPSEDLVFILHLSDNYIKMVELITKKGQVILMKQ